MVGIVIVAHSRELADAVCTLVRQMLREEVPLASAGGIDDPAHPFGTDVPHICKAIESVYSDDGVLVLMDMGSAILSAETALEFLPERYRSHILLCEAPIVEGAVAAAVASEGGGTLDEVAGEAREALQVKVDQLGVGAPSFEEGWGEEPAAEKSVKLTVSNPLGIHARPAALLVSTASRYAADIRIRNLSRDSAAVSAKSINQVSLLGVRQGNEILITASGPGAEDAIAALTDIVKEGLGDAHRGSLIEESLPRQTRAEGAEQLRIPSSALEGELKGIPASPGLAVAPAVLYQPRVLSLPDRESRDPEEEWSLLCNAIEAVKAELRNMRGRVFQRARENEAAIFDAHLLSLDDEYLLQSIRGNIFSAGMTAERSWSGAVDELLESYRGLDSPYLQARTADLEDLKGQVLRMLIGDGVFSFALIDERVVVASDLTPSDVGRFDVEKVAGICTAFGGATSHSAILARALGIPAVVGLGPEVLRLADGTLLAVDGDRGIVQVNPGDVETLKVRMASGPHLRVRPPGDPGKQAVTVDGRRIAVVANVSSVREVTTAVQYGAEGIGVLRTEFLFLKRLTAPGEEEQAEVYRRISEELGERPLVIRVLDAGGDKSLAFLPQDHEPNPFLGVRGLRLLLEHPDLFRTQLRAILRGAVFPKTTGTLQGTCSGRRLGVLLPMVSTVDEVRQARAMLSSTQHELQAEGAPFEGGAALGIMVEVPSSAVMAAELVHEVDFLSIGTNDLGQYVMSADRTNEGVSRLCDALHPAVLRMVSSVVRAGREAGRSVGVCGEIAGDTHAVPLLVGLGVDELSMNPLSVPGVKDAVSRLDTREASRLAGDALKQQSAEEVRKLLAEYAGP